MTNKIIFFCLFTSLMAFGQKNHSLEDQTYEAIDYFTANPTPEGIEKLSTVEINFWKNQNKKSKDALLSIVILDCSKAYFENKFGKTNEAIASYEKAWKTYQNYKLSDYDIVEYCLKPLGNLYTIIGDYDNAENTIKQYYFLANAKKNENNKIAAILNLSNVYQNSGRNYLAIDLLEKTIRTEKLSNIQKGTLLNNLGNSYVLSYKDPNPAFPIRNDFFQNLEKHYLEAIKLLKNEKDQSETLANCYRNLSALNAQWQNFELANAYFIKARVEFEKSPNSSPRKKAQFYFDEANILFKLGKPNESNSVITSIFKILIPDYLSKKSILPKKNSLYAESILLDALDLQAEIFKIENQPKKALESYELAFHIEELFQSLLVYENSKIINQIRNRNRTEKCIAIYKSLFEKEHKTIYLEKAFQLSEYTKSAILQRGISNSKTQSIAEKQLSEQLQNQNSIILKEQQKEDQADIVKINEAIKKQNELMLLLKQSQIKKEDKAVQDINLDNLYAKLEKNNAVMAEYFSGAENMYLFTIVDKKIYLSSFSNDAHTSVKIKQFIDFFNDPKNIVNNPKNYNHYANAAYQLLKLPKNSASKNLIIIPDGILNFLPFEALITQESSTANFAQMHYLLNDYNIGYENSAGFYLSFNKRKKQREETVLGIFPVFENTPYTLSYSKDEMQSIQKNFKGKYFKNAAASFENFKRNAADYSIIHLSTHAASGDIETPASIKFYDQEILYSELYHLNINPDLVVLSACETGIGKLFKSEGAMSVARGFQFAGAQNLLFSLWKVNDYTTSIFMDSFYQNIKNGQSYIEANANTKRDFLKNKNISNAKKSPYYWAAFVYYGNIEGRHECNYLLFGLVICAVLVGGVLLFKFITKRIKKEKLKFKNQ
ncbi:CHAT domain-containing protein [Flavobacterium sp. HJJ]|uniref:CHAT domain-containing protein n=1 Tax=Flavobacterium sp. HJJ TaxID=2783792 RepID=UPI00188CADCE|nr:CHAT domain-containing protein [Flavobacterium sp. HJJ]MBF4473288.1 CHAT domain-containing protein [Flavobacterium sp. HJJ]